MHEICGKSDSYFGGEPKSPLYKCVCENNCLREVQHLFRNRWETRVQCLMHEGVLKLGGVHQS